MNPTFDISSTNPVLAVDQTPEAIVRQRIFNRDVTDSKTGSGILALIRRVAENYLSDSRGSSPYYTRLLRLH
jgi:hypothetical protein